MLLLSGLRCQLLLLLLLCKSLCHFLFELRKSNVNEFLQLSRDQLRLRHGVRVPRDQR